MTPLLLIHFHHPEKTIREIRDLNGICCVCDYTDGTRSVRWGPPKGHCYTSQSAEQGWKWRAVGALDGFLAGQYSDGHHTNRAPYYPGEPDTLEEMDWLMRDIFEIKDRQRAEVRLALLVDGYFRRRNIIHGLAVQGTWTHDDGRVERLPLTEIAKSMTLRIVEQTGTLPTKKNLRESVEKECGTGKVSDSQWADTLGRARLKKLPADKPKTRRRSDLRVTRRTSD